MTSQEQLDLWVEGTSVHNHDAVVHIVDNDDKVIATKKIEGGECCPDFSCCNIDLKWPEDLRRKFKEAGEEVRHAMLFMSLSQVAAQEGVNIAGESVVGGFVLGGTPVQ